MRRGVYFTEVPLKACFQKGLKENKQDPQGLIFSLLGIPTGITKGNPMNLYFRLDTFSQPGNDIIIQKYAS